MKTPITQHALLIEYYKNHPNRDIPHKEIVDWILPEYFKRTGKPFRDPDRGIRKLYQIGFLQKIKKGIYRYDPAYMLSRQLEDFTPTLKAAIFKRDNYRCVVCGNGREEGFDIHVDHIKAKDFGGKATLENGQTLCGPHNMFKKNYKQTETGKRIFLRLYEQATVDNDQQLLQFCKDILTAFEKHKIDDHIPWIR